IGAHDLGRRVPDPRTGDEIARRAGTMNTMLARLDEAVTRAEPVHLASPRAGGIATRTPEKHSGTPSPASPSRCP
ncbi:HAMP domain-containing protein, partial [Amycolatopsis mediterranei]